MKEGNRFLNMAFASVATEDPRALPFAMRLRQKDIHSVAEVVSHSEDELFRLVRTTPRNRARVRGLVRAMGLEFRAA